MMKRRFPELLILSVSLLILFTWGDGRAGPVPLTASNEDSILILPDREYAPVLREYLDGARQEILVGMYLFRTDDSRKNPTNRIQRALENASQRGVVVKVLLEREEDSNSTLTENNRKTARRLENHGIQVYFDPPVKRTHAKVFVIDRRYVFFGSHNMTRSALQSNHELSVMVSSPLFAEEVARYIEGIISESTRKTTWERFKDIFR